MGNSLEKCSTHFLIIICLHPERVMFPLDKCSTHFLMSFTYEQTICMAHMSIKLNFIVEQGVHFMIRMMSNQTISQPHEFELVAAAS